MPHAGFYNQLIEALPAERVRALQESKLRLQLAYTYARSALYRSRLDHHGIRPEDVRTLDDLSRLPLTTRAELLESQAARPPLGLHAAAPRHEVARIIAAAGPGAPTLYTGLTRHDWAVWAEATARAYWAQGVRPGDVVVLALGPEAPGLGALAQQALEQIGAAAIPVDPGRPRQVIGAIHSLGADTLSCAPSDCRALADYLRATLQTEPISLGLRRLALSAEPGSGAPGLLRQLEAEWGAAAAEALGRGDLLARFAADCAERGGMHLIAPDFLIAELVDPESGRPVGLDQPGARGELVVTQIDQQCGPVIRLRTGELVSAEAGPCPCGRTGPRLRYHGRVDELLVVGGVQLLPTAVRDVLLELRPYATGAMQIMLSTPGLRVDPPLRLLVEYGPDVADLGGFKQDVEAALRRRLAVCAVAEPIPPGSLPQGKAQAGLVRRSPRRG